MLAVKSRDTVTSSNRMPFVVNNQIDLECGSTAHIVERETLVAFSNSFFQYAHAHDGASASRASRISRIWPAKPS